MIINLNILPKTFNDDITLGEEYYKLSKITKMDPVHVEGKIDYDLTDEVRIDLRVSGTMYLVDSLTLKEVKYPFNFKIDELLMDLVAENEKYYEKSKNTLDIIEFLWENIVLEVPISYTEEKDFTLEGEGWALNKKELDEEPHNGFEDLDKLLKGGEEDGCSIQKN